MSNNRNNVREGIEEGVKRHVDKAKKIINKEVNKKSDKIQAYRKEASRLASMANKRLKRLENAGLTDSPAYKATGGQRFGVRGKGHNALQQEVARMNKFLNSATSTIRGSNQVLKTMAESTGIQYSNLKDLRAKAKTFFELASKVEQYLRTVEDIASAYGSTQLFTAINEYVKKAKIDLGDSEQDVNKLVGEIGKALTEFDKPISINEGWLNTWFKLPKG